MAGTKYTRKPVKKVAKKNQSITQTGVKKKSVLGRALKNTAKGLGKGAMVVGSMSPAGRGVKSAKLIKKAFKTINKKMKGPITKGHKAGVAKFNKRVAEAKKPTSYKKKETRVKNLKNKRVGKMNKEIEKGINPFPMKVNTRNGGASDMGRSAEGSTKHLLRSAEKAKSDFKKGYKVKTVKGNPGKFKSREFLKKIKRQKMQGQ